MSFRHVPRLVLFVTFLSAPSAHAREKAARPSAVREIVIGNEALVAGGTHVPENTEAFVKRLEEVGGFPKGSLHGKAFTSPRQALDYMRANKVPFAILPVHQYLQARKELKLSVLGRAVGLEGPSVGMWGIARNEKLPYDHLENASGIRLAMSEIDDPVWLRMLFEGNVRDPASQYSLVEIPTGAEAVAAVLSKKVDAALIDEREFAPLKPRIEKKIDLAWIYASGTLAPPAVVASEKFSTAAERARLSAALASVCKKEGADACGRMAILYLESGRAESYAGVIKKYESYR